MTSRERLQKTLSHESPDRVCVDFGATPVTGIAASTLSKLRQAVLGEPGYRVKVIEPYQMLGEIDEPLRDALGIDVVGAPAQKNMFGFANQDWKPFTLFDGTEVLVPGQFNVTPSPDGGWFMYPEGDTSLPPCAKMPKGGFYFDTLSRQEPIDEDKLDPRDNLEEFKPLSDQDIQGYVQRAQQGAAAGKGVVLGTPGTAFGDIALVPALWLRHPKGIRDVEEWYVSTVSRRDYVYKVFEAQCQIALRNLERLIPPLGDTVQVAFVTGTDFGTQHGSFISPRAYRDLYKPFHKTINDFIHRHSKWKIFIHSCGSVVNLIPDFIEAGFDILNPVQCSAAGMDAQTLKTRFGKDLVFWGGGIDTQRVLPFGTANEVAEQVEERIRIFGAGGGFVFNSIHNVQAMVPVENVLAMFHAIRESAN